MIVRSRWLFTLLLLALAACGDEGSSALGVNNVSPLGSIGGLVLNAASLAPMEKVDVNIIAGGSVYPADGSTAQTDASGRFSVQNIPAGDVIIQLKPSQSGIQPVDITDSLSNSAGDFPLANAILSLGPIGLVPLVTEASKAFQVQLVTPDGAAAPKVTAFLRTAVGWIDFSDGTPKAKGTTVTETQSSNLGMLVFKDIPNFSKMAGLVGSGGISDAVRMRIPPYDRDNDGIMDFLGKEVIYYVNQYADHIPTLVLSNSTTAALDIEASSIAALMGKKGNRELASTSGPLYITFNYPLDSTLTRIAMHTESGTTITTIPTKTVSGNVMTLQFSGLSAGNEYNLSIYAVASVNDLVLSDTFGAPIFTPSTKTSVTSSLARASSDITSSNYTKINVTFSEPIGTGTAGENLSGANCVVFFNYDIDGSGKIGDGMGERGYTISNVPLFNNEPVPPGAAGRSGLTTTWYFTLPVDSLGSAVPAQTSMDILFSRSSSTVQRSSGEVVADMTSLIVPN